jgi:trimeric autotransporter adhesin
MPTGALIAAGLFVTAGGAAASNIASWNGSVWSALGAGPWNVSGPVYALKVLSDGSMAVGGAFGSAGDGPASQAARWNGSGWSPLGSGLNSWVLSLAQSAGGDLYAGGTFFTPNLSRVARLNGTVWSPLGGGVSSIVNALALLPNSDLVVAGSFGTAGGTVTANNIARWNGSGWSALGSGTSGPFPAQVDALVVLPGGELVAGGSFGTAWAALGTGVNGEVFALAVLPSGALVAGGAFTSAGGQSTSKIAQWNGLAWLPLGSGMGPTTETGSPSAVRALTVLSNGDLIAGGTFTTAGGFAALRVARWNGLAWSALGDGTNGEVRALAPGPGGEIIAGGTFTTAGGAPSAFWARWSDNPAPWVAVPPTPQTVPAYSTAIFAAAPASGYSGVSFQWRRDGAAIGDGPGGASPQGGVVSGASGTLASPTDGAPVQLTITGVRPGDAGSYTVVFTNTCGAAESNPAPLTVIPVCGTSDFNGDGDFGTDQDIEAFFACLAGNCCATCWPGGADFNGDGDTGTDQDIEAFFRVLAGQTC